MKVDKQDFYFGAALLQIAQHPTPTTINAVAAGKELRQSSNKFRVNKAVIYMKYTEKASVAKRGKCFGNKKELRYKFTFTPRQLKEIRQLDKMAKGKAFVVLICTKAEEICCIPAAGIFELAKTVKAKSTLAIHATLANKSQFRYYKGWDTEVSTVPRKSFPNVLFD